MKYIATFYSHFGAIRFQRICKENGIVAGLSPVPRNLSSSCGTCVIFEKDSGRTFENIPEEVEQIVEVSENGYVQVYKAENS